MEHTSLYLVPTPIGNLGDITLRALEILKSVDLILAEDTRTSGFLLKHYSIDKPLKSFHNFNEHRTVSTLVERMQQGETFALVSDAGTPGISDPGFLISRAAVQAGLKIECLPGATAFVPALVKSGLPCDRFVFEGFLPVKKGRQTLLKSLVDEERTLVFYESPYRLTKTLEQFCEYFGDERQASVSRELTKKFEETFNGSLQQVLQHFSQKEVKGEIVLVVAGKSKQTAGEKPSKYHSEEED
ncbi:16S rRNA (cytidine(1402)-2'-O)-methyltransferase [Chryseotalea sanaruensis]|uniref:Ribosomal RNA small subunit methyltransferase I n=1 Tax=Chryseotalea sanaruensis TaxID=2482724 RepID=A0A401UCI1_9BACT|nr:16S rRNA (cytidine(1402)-2'-O)-methyltransferase [Chryseotalea sanaruensis]GCC52596.1 16S rRNA (cytidine(1402)-2'-O)-methyltransferase [Chryseotalea sanaruensis]